MAVFENTPGDYRPAATPVKRVQVSPTAPKASGPTAPVYRQRNKKADDMESLRTMPRFSPPARTPTPAQAARLPIAPFNQAQQYNAIQELRDQYRMQYRDVASPVKKSENIYSGVEADAAEQARRKRLAALTIPVRMMTGRESGTAAPATRMPTYTGSVYRPSSVTYQPLAQTRNPNQLITTVL